LNDELVETRNKLRAKLAVTREGKTELEALIEQAHELPPQGLDLPADVRIPASFVSAGGASTRDLYTALARFAGVNIVFDPAFRDQPVTIDLQDTTFEDALDALGGATRNFHRVTAPRTITIIPDTPAKRREYEEEVVRTFYLSNADLKETLDLLRIVIDNRRLAPVNAINAIAVKDTPERIAAAARVINAIDKARPEVVIDVELLEVDRTRIREYGLHITTPGNEEGGVVGSVDVNRPGLTLHDLRNRTLSDVFVTGVPGLIYRLIRNDSSTRTLANPQLRTSEGLAAEARFGERVPVPVTTFVPIAGGGVSQQPITSFNYETIGVNLSILPRLHHDDDVSLNLKAEISNISGTGFGNLPTFGSRAISTTIRLRDGETSMLAGLIRDNERQLVQGVPGLTDLPLVGRLFARNRREAQETDIILTLTPHIIRVLDLTEGDLRAFKIGRDAGAPLVDLPMPIELPEAAPPGQQPPGQQPPGQPPGQPPTPPPAPPRDQPSEPIRPPEPVRPPQ
jgi:general secretion pathway protein D